MALNVFDIKTSVDVNEKDMGHLHAMMDNLLQDVIVSIRRLPSSAKL